MVNYLKATDSLLLNKILSLAKVSLLWQGYFNLFLSYEIFFVTLEFLFIVFLLC